MAYHIAGTWMGPCSCKVGCPCVLGELEADRGWCSAVGIFDIKRGTVDGVDVSGTKAALVVDWPSGLLKGNGTGHVYFDTAVSEKQQAALLPVLEVSAAESSRSLRPSSLTCWESNGRRSLSRATRKGRPSRLVTLPSFRSKRSREQAVRSHR